MSEMGDSKSKMIFSYLSSIKEEENRINEKRTVRLGFVSSKLSAKFCVKERICDTIPIYQFKYLGEKIFIFLVI